MKKLLFVMNPFAGMRKANKYLPQILSEFCAAQYEVTVYMTQGPGDGKRVVCQRAKNVDLVVCCGGDGTFNEVVAGVMESGVPLPLGYIPAGSTNDFAASLGLPNDPIKATRAILEGKPEEFDVCCFGGRYFTYVASFGAFTKASYNTPQGAKNALGHTAYLFSGMQELTSIRPLPVSVEVNGERIEGPFLFGAICNSTNLGGVLTLDPQQVDMRDGLFEILLIRQPKDLSEITECLVALQKREYNCNMITFRSAQKATVYMGSELTWTLDGEKEEGRSEVVVENLHRAFRLIR